LQFPLSVKKEGAFQVFEGSVPIKRLVFGIGDGEWKDTSVVADEVMIKFRIVAQ
jgi:polyisoprenoid-binding protein YceI